LSAGFSVKIMHHSNGQYLDGCPGKSSRYETT